MESIHFSNLHLKLTLMQLPLKIKKTILKFLIRFASPDCAKNFNFNLHSVFHCQKIKKKNKRIKWFNNVNETPNKLIIIMKDFIFMSERLQEHIFKTMMALNELKWMRNPNTAIHSWWENWNHTSLIFQIVSCVSCLLYTCLYICRFFFPSLAQYF